MNMSNYSDKGYDDALKAIFTRFPSIQNVGFDAKEGAYKPGLEHMLRFAEILGNPHHDWPSIHVAGTNGKGSVANMLASVLGATGLKVGLYTSPHLVDFRERMRVWIPESGNSQGGHSEMVSKEYVFGFLQHYRPDFERQDLSFFEITTGLAFKWFSDINVDVAVVEVGLGGRLDSTNIITPQLSIVTSIGMDHCDLLGHTLAAIAGEKAGIFKKDVPALVGEYLPETRPVFEAKAKNLCPLTFAEDITPSLWGSSEQILENMDLQGQYQAKNLRTTLAAVDILMNEYPGLKDSALVSNALEHTAARMGFHGRWERLGRNPLIISDIGHNPPALKKNFAQLEDMMASGKYSKLIIVYAVMADKDLDGIMQLMPKEAIYIFTNPKIGRALPASQIQQRYAAFREKNSLGPIATYSFTDVKEALRKALSLADADSLVYLGGSAYLYAEASSALKELQDLRLSGFSLSKNLSYE
jgi:dihydrofolate synthase/folylpolyglutamate synthase